MRWEIQVEAYGPEVRNHLVEGRYSTLLGVVRCYGEHLALLDLLLEDVVGERGQGLLRTHLYEGPASHLVGLLDLAYPFDRVGHLLFEKVEHCLLQDRRVPIHRIGIGSDVREYGYLGRPYGKFRKVCPQDVLGRGHYLGVEGMGDREQLGLHPLLLEPPHGLFDRRRAACDHGLDVTVLVGGYHIAVYLLQDRFHGIETGHYGCHLALVVYLQVPHLPPAGRHGP